MADHVWHLSRKTAKPIETVTIVGPVAPDFRAVLTVTNNGPDPVEVRAGARIVRVVAPMQSAAMQTMGEIALALTGMGLVANGHFTIRG
jgi:hypothetical protein